MSCRAVGYFPTGCPSVRVVNEKDKGAGPPRAAIITIGEQNTCTLKMHVRIWHPKALSSGTI